MAEPAEVDSAFSGLEKQAERLISKTRLLQAQRDLLLKAVREALDDLRDGRPELARAGLDGALICIGGQDQ